VGGALDDADGAGAPGEGLASADGEAVAGVRPAELGVGVSQPDGETEVLTGGPLG